MEQSRKKYVWIKRAVIFIMAYACLLSVGRLLPIVGYTHSFYGVGVFGYNIWAVGLYVLLVIGWKRVLNRKNRRLHIAAGFLGLLLAFAVVYGTYAHFVNNIFIDVRTVFLQFGLVLGIAIATIPLSEEIFLFFDRIQAWYARKISTGENIPQTLRNPLFCFLLSWLVIFLAWLPLFLANWPGNFVFDAKYQLREALGITHYSTHHPLLHTLLMWWAYKLGLHMGNVSAGFQFYTIFQMLVLSSAFAYMIYYMYRKGIPRCFRVGALLWYALFPMHGLFAISATKDVLFAAFFLYMMIFLVRLLYDKEKLSWISYGGLIVSGILSMLFRNNAVYAIVAGFCLTAVLCRTWKERILLVALMIAMFVGFQLGEHILITATSAPSPDTYRERNCAPLQCLARVACYRRADLDDADYGAICVYIREGDISGYNPYLADAIKNNANEAALRSDSANFWKLWAKLGLRFPGEYLESIITNTMGYWYPLDSGTYVVMGVSLYHTLIETEHEIEKHSYCPWAEKIYNYFFWAGHWTEVPLLGYSFRPDSYVWLLISAILWALYRRQRMFTGLMAVPFMYFGTCLLGPTVALRYVYCLIVLVPLFFYMIMRAGGRKRKE